MWIFVPALLCLLAAAPAQAQLRRVELGFEGVNCAPCLESLPARVQRLRGVERAAVDSARGILTVELAAANRVRLEQLRDIVEQDGTKARRAVIAAAGVLREEPAASGRWTFEVPNPAGPVRFVLTLDGAAPSVQYSPKAGPASVSGAVPDLHPPTGRSMHLSPTAIELRDEE